MLDEGYIDQARYDAAVNEPLLVSQRQHKAQLGSTSRRKYGVT